MQSAPRPIAFVRTAAQNGERPPRSVFRLRLRYFRRGAWFFLSYFFLFFFLVLLSSWEAKGESCPNSNGSLQLRNVPRKEAHVARVAYMRFIIMLQRVRCVTKSVVIILITGGPWVRRNYCREKLVLSICPAVSAFRLHSPLGNVHRKFLENLHLFLSFVKFHSWSFIGKVLRWS